MLDTINQQLNAMDMHILDHFRFYFMVELILACSTRMAYPEQNRWIVGIDDAKFRLIDE